MTPNTIPTLIGGGVDCRGAQGALAARPVVGELRREEGMLAVADDALE
jgi:hypothetical protein